MLLASVLQSGIIQTEEYFILIAQHAGDKTSPWNNDQIKNIYTYSKKQAGLNMPLSMELSFYKYISFNRFATISFSGSYRPKIIFQLEVGFGGVTSRDSFLAMVLALCTSCCIFHHLMKNVAGIPHNGGGGRWTELGIQHTNFTTGIPKTPKTKKWGGLTLRHSLNTEISALGRVTL